MQTTSLTTTLFALLPAIALILSGCVAFFHRPGPKLTSISHHFAAGVILAAVAIGLLPKIEGTGFSITMILGFLFGMCVMLGVQWFDKRLERLSRGKQESPIGFLVAMAIDLLIDGILMGVGFLAAPSSGKLIAIAVTLEVLFLGITIVINLENSGRSKLYQLITVLGLAALLPLGALVSFDLLSHVSEIWLIDILAFGAAALLYLATEELLTEAHEHPDTPWLTSTFFLGFLFVMILEAYLE